MVDLKLFVLFLILFSLPPPPALTGLSTIIAACATQHPLLSSVVTECERQRKCRREAIRGRPPSDGPISELQSFAPLDSKWSPQTSLEVRPRSLQIRSNVAKIVLDDIGGVPRRL
ncbi:hypothetical protein AcW1_003194 [Taiwanofungus camphoratus]|nr:hypothetical protein AcV7_005906 [Antrodia cinnamomea]KAI0942611.1 hypothetical protein AcW1_003194 [Antrodia cinnamomea]